MRRLGLAVLPLAALALGACSSARFAEVANLNDPRAVVDASVDGTTVALRPGGALVVRLPVTPGDGNRWELAPLAVEPLGSPIRIDLAPAEGFGSLPPLPPYSGVLASLNPPGATREQPADASKPEPVITKGEAVLRLRGVREGRATVQLDYRAADTPGAPAQKTVRFDVAVAK